MIKIRVSVVALMCGLLLSFVSVQAEGLRTVFINVGDGDGALVACGGEYMLIDTGRVGAWEHVKEVLEQAGVEMLSYMVLTHPHVDHVGSAVTVTDEYSVGAVILPPIEYDTIAYGDVLEAMTNRGIDMIHPRVGDVFTLGDAEIVVYGPPPVAYSTENDWSVVLMLRYAGRSILFTGDIEARVEDDLIAMNGKYPLDADVLKVSHHGSDTSTTRSFVEAVSPIYAVVSCRSNTRWSYPSTDVAMTLVECGVLDILTTEACGDIEVFINSEGVLTIGAMEDDAVPDAA